MSILIFSLVQIIMRHPLRTLLILRIHISLYIADTEKYIQRITSPNSKSSTKSVPIQGFLTRHQHGHQRPDIQMIRKQLFRWNLESKFCQCLHFFPHLFALHIDICFQKLNLSHQIKIKFI